MKIKVLSLNMWMGNYLKRVVKLIERVDPDVVMFQEITSGPDLHLTLGTANAYEQLRKSLELNSIFAPMWQVSNKRKEYSVGVAVFFRHEFVDSFSKRYFGEIEKLDQNETSNGNSPGVVAGVVLKFGDVKVELITTHFLWSMFPEINDRQRSAVVELIKLISKRDNVVLGGDFNVTRDSEIYRSLTKVLVDDMKDVPESTLDPIIHRAGEKDLAVDFIFHKGPELKKISARVLEDHVSDHRACLVEYEV